ncbi:MAG: hypothetical protein ACYSX0_11935, partial [Planctomycetota bacterium]
MALLALCLGCLNGDGPTALPAVTNPDPIADAGIDRAGAVTRDMSNPGTTAILFLNGRASLGQDFVWTVLSQPAGSMHVFTSANAPVTGFYADTVGEYRIRLVVGNGQGKSDTDQATVSLIADLDGDGLADGMDADRDGDGFLGAADLFPDDRASHGDEDNDQVSNAWTPDVDGDGVIDTEDGYPLDPTRTAYETYAEATEGTLSNQNDGISVAENAGNVPKRVTGTVDATSNRTDIDFYVVVFDAPGRYSVICTGAVSAMTPSVSILRPDGTAPVDTTAANLDTGPGTTAISVFIPSAATYYL